MKYLIIIALLMGACGEAPVAATPEPDPSDDWTRVVRLQSRGNPLPVTRDVYYNGRLRFSDSFTGDRITHIAEFTAGNPGDPLTLDIYTRLQAYEFSDHYAITTDVFFGSEYAYSVTHKAWQELVHSSFSLPD